MTEINTTYENYIELAVKLSRRPASRLVWERLSPEYQSQKIISMQEDLHQKEEEK